MANTAATRSNHWSTACTSIPAQHEADPNAPGAETQSAGDVVGSAPVDHAATTEISDVRKLRVGSLFLNDLEALLHRLDDNQFKAFWRFRVEFVVGGCVGLPDDDQTLIKALGCRKWPALKNTLLRLGYLSHEDGKLFDHDVEDSIKRQRKNSERQRERAKQRWSNESAARTSLTVAA
jgi:hypothetical protein